MTLDHIHGIATQYRFLIDTARVQDMQLQHALWMCQEIEGMADRDKAMRWLCFVQGVLYCHELRSIDDMRLDNRSP